MILVTSCRTEPKYQLKVRFDLQILAISEAQILNEVSSDVLPTNNNKF